MTAVLATFAFVLGTIVGSFLNACIHRLPRGISLDRPRRSFCPACQVTIPWYYNLPIVSWLWLRGRCAKCHAPISPRYLLVEILTGLIFLGLWLQFGLPLAPVYFVFAALLIVATFIDFEHTIIPDEITLGGTVAGLIFSAAVPALMGVDSRVHAVLLSLAGAALGAGLLWLVVECGKLAFGRKRIVPPQPEPFHFEPDAENPRLILGGEPWPWDEIFSRPRDVLVIETVHGTLNGRPLPAGDLRIFFDRVVIEGRTVPLEEVRDLRGVLRSVVIPREAMGLGDVKFMACIGAFLGWQAVLFTVAASSVVGALVGGGLLLATRGRAGGRIPYGPYLALGAALWVVTGPALVAWYLGLLRPVVP